MCSGRGIGRIAHAALMFQNVHVHLQICSPCSCAFSVVAGIGAGFYLGYSWLPSFFTKHAGIPQPLTLWMVLSGMVIFTFVVPVSVILLLLLLLCI
jgi:hypothetical protein